MNNTTNALKNPDASRDRSRAIGSILVEQKLLTPANVDEIQRYASANNIKFGEAALQLGMLSQSDIDLGIAHQFNYPILNRGGKNGVSDEVPAAYTPQSEAIESLRALRSQLSLRWHSHVGRRILAVTGPGRGEGRSWLAANLATVFAQMGERTLLIDADMRHPRQHDMFNLENSIGLSALLTGRAGREAVSRIHPQLRLFVLTAGSLPPNPQELLGRPAFDVILNSFSEQYDLVILDTPAAADFADAQILAMRAGASLIVTRKNHTKHSQLRAMMDSFLQTEVKVIGSVINEH
jgi:receptor protein-tyrosine kinase